MITGAFPSVEENDPNPALPLHQMLAEEFQALGGGEPENYNKTAHQADNKRLTALIKDLHKHPRAALCLSGGGIRSATFALGILQGLAGCRLLDKFHYLSTVSGGGYIGSWLTAWIHHLTEETKGPGTHCAATDENWDRKRTKALETVVLKLSDVQREDPRQPEASPIWHLREYSNYLSPKLGFLSADTWTLVAIYIRNLLLNWLVLVPLLAAVLAVPRLCAAVTKWTPPKESEIWLLSMPLIGGLFLVWAVVEITIHLPSSDAHQLSFAEKDERWTQRDFLRKCLLPLILSVFILTTFWAWWRNSHHDLSSYGLPDWALVALFGTALHLVAHACAVIKSRKWSVIKFIGAILSGALAGWLLWAVITKLPDPKSSPDVFSCFATPLVLAVFLLAMVLYIGVTSTESKTGVVTTTDEDHEWWARAGAWLLIGCVMWLAISGLALFGPCFLQLGWKSLSAVGGVSGMVTVFLGASAKTKANAQGEGGKAETKGIGSIVLNKAPELAAPVFAAFLVVLISISTTALISAVVLKNEQFFREEVRGFRESTAKIVPNPAKVSVTAVVESAANANTSTVLRAESKEEIKENWLPAGLLNHRAVVSYTPWWLALGCIVTFGGLGLIAAWFVNVNIFSMHGMYRDRLIRAYLGASRPDHERQPNPFTGFDPKDNIDMYCLWPRRESAKSDSLTGACPRPLFPVINIALNLVHGSKLAWQERKAESFTVSPLHCGSLDIKDGKGYRHTDAGGRVDPAGSQTPHGSPSNRYAGGITLGTAVTISGAAVSPNWGYHSSPLVAFILTLFNARLGCWLGNPGEAGNNTYSQWYPTLGVTPIIHEALGLTDDLYKYIYLSDGGHFENMGLYEMVLRRCHVIFLSDAEQDEKFTYEGLGNAIRKIRIDFGIPIEFQEQPLFDQTECGSHPKKPSRCAIGSIRYSAVDRTKVEDDGVLIYIKPVCYGTEPRDVVQYSSNHKEFPHEATVNQFFGESQFESYRMLGLHTMQELCNGTIRDFNDFIAKIRKGLSTAKSFHGVRFHFR